MIGVIVLDGLLIGFAKVNVDSGGYPAMAVHLGGRKFTVTSAKYWDATK